MLREWVLERMLLSYFWHCHFGTQVSLQLFSVSLLCSQNLGIRVDSHCTCLWCFHVVLLPLLRIPTQRRRRLQRRLDSVAILANFRRELTLVVGIDLVRQTMRWQQRWVVLWLCRLLFDLAFSFWRSYTWHSSCLHLKQKPCYHRCPWVNGMNSCHVDSCYAAMKSSRFVSKL